MEFEPEVVADMAYKTIFTPVEWQKLLEAPLLAGFVGTGLDVSKLIRHFFGVRRRTGSSTRIRKRNTSRFDFEREVVAVNANEVN